MRIGALSGVKPWDARLDPRHTVRLKVLVRRFGWPTYAMVGKRGATATWYLVQHADHDVRWQERCLRLMRAAAACGQASLTHLAMLTDRTLVNRGKRQQYGSQWYTDDRGVFRPRPIRSRRSLSILRRAAGMESFRTYERTTRAMERRYRLARTRRLARE